MSTSAFAISTRRRRRAFPGCRRSRKLSRASDPSARRFVALQNLRRQLAQPPPTFEQLARALVPVLPAGSAPESYRRNALESVLRARVCPLRNRRQLRHARDVSSPRPSGVGRWCVHSYPDPLRDRELRVARQRATAHDADKSRGSAECSECAVYERRQQSGHGHRSTADTNSCERPHRLGSQARSASSVGAADDYFRNGCGPAP
jgi:hypothetical protein